jgi:superfamily II DNA or RNA helicase
MTLSEFLEGKFRGDIRYRGSAYVQAERVAIAQVTAEQVMGVVRDGTEYRTQLSRDGDELRMFCTCPQGSRPQPACKHLWATILAVDAGEYLAGSPKAGYIPPFASESVPLTFEDDEWADDVEEDVSQPRSSGGALQRKAAPEVPVRAWEGQLNELRERMAGGETTTASATDREREIFYEIDVDASSDAGKLVIRVAQRQRRANGQWGKLKPLKIPADRLDEIEHVEDRRVLAYLIGGTPERTTWVAQQAEARATADRYQVSCELGELLFPLMCETGRVRFLDANQKGVEGLKWDEGPPWELALRVESDADSEQWRLRGRLLRGDAALELEEARLIVPGGLVVTENEIARLRDYDAFEWLSLIRSGEPFEVPAAEGEELIERLLDIPALPRLELPKELQLEEVHCNPVPSLLLKTPARSRWHVDRLSGEISFDYLGTTIRGASVNWAIVQREEGRCIVRNQEDEAKAWHQLEASGFRRLVDRRRGSHDVDIAAHGLGQAVRTLVGEGWQVHADGKQVRQPAEMKLRVESGIDWFELHADVDFEGQTASFPELLSALGRGDGTVRLDDGSLGIIPEEWIARFGLLSGLGIADGDHVRFEKNQAALLDALLASQADVEYDDKFLDITKRLKSFSGVTQVAEPENFHGELREYQRQGLGWLDFLQEFGFGGCLADDMGLGKTIQVLALLVQRQASRPQRRTSLIVVPKSLMFNWFQECERFTPGLKVLEYSGLDRAALRPDFDKYDIVLTTYGTLRRDIIYLKDIPFDYVVLDEAQTIKNAGSQVAKASRLLQAEHRMALSGTPIENHVGDLWSIFEFLNPGMLGRSSLFKLYASDSTDEASRGLLARGLHPFILRRTKKEVASELPEKLEQTVYCEMDEEQQRLYDELRDHYRASLLGLVDEQGLAKSKMHVLEALLRLRQAACHPALLNRAAAEDPSAKLDVLIPHIEELIGEGHKTLVFSQFTSMLSIVRQHLDAKGVTYEYLDGKTRDRKAHVERFQTDPDCGVFLISLKAGGLGLNLTAADYVFLLDPWWNPAVEAQAIDRAHRVGQTKQVFAYRMIVRGTVEEKIAELQAKKRGLADAILQADNNLIRDLTSDDLKMLLS